MDIKYEIEPVFKIEFFKIKCIDFKNKKKKLEKALAKQKEALKGKVGGVTKPKNSPPATNNTGTKSSAPSMKKNLTLETDNFLKEDNKEDEKEKNDFDDWLKSN